MNWMNRLNHRAELMGRMLETIGVNTHDLEGHIPGEELNAAAARCEDCSHAGECRTWLEQNACGSSVPMEACPNHDLFVTWSNKPPKSTS
ncbi:DUF6455 family protein [Roseibium sediminis]|uniref:DUF6455 family protein n=1 Tax=Roseibium sediminis TaxID=1775174 RepID=UPI00123D15BE|nr:DUF6455 family protein [Roseibium sediminis]